MEDIDTRQWVGLVMWSVTVSGIGIVMILLDLWSETLAWRIGGSERHDGFGLGFEWQWKYRRYVEARILSLVVCELTEEIVGAKWLKW